MCGMTPPPAIVACTEPDGVMRCHGAHLRTENARRTPMFTTETCAARNQPEADHPAFGPGAHLDKGIQLFITTNGQLEMARRDTLDLQVSGKVSCCAAPRQTGAKQFALAEKRQRRAQSPEGRHLSRRQQKHTSWSMSTRAAPSSPWRHCQPAPAPLLSDTLHNRHLLSNCLIRNVSV